jgi:hypothetical protein
MAFNISEFAAAGLPLGGARPSLFSVIVDTPTGVPNVGARFNFTCKAAQIPASTLGVIPINSFGRDVKFAGNRVFAPWTVTVLNDEDFAIRQAMEIWSNNINRHEANIRDTALATNSSYRTTATVTQYGKTGIPVRTYEFVNIFPQEVGAIALSWDDGEAIEQFDVSFEYDFWRIVAPTTTGVIAV